MNIKLELENYLKENLNPPVEKKSFFKRQAKNLENLVLGSSSNELCEYVCELPSPKIDEYLIKEKEDNKFQKLLFNYIDNKNLKDSDVYNSVNIDRRLFSKIRNDVDYHPKKETVILLGIALNLNEDELLELLNTASYSLPKNNVFDLIIRFCFKNRIYNLSTINELLYSHNCKTL